MLGINPQPNYSGSTTTLDSGAEGRLKVDVIGRKKKKAIIKKYLNKKHA
ncbi:MAG: hypothetical protein AABY22_35865 [Nanoarchaeota archaeon]